MTEEVDIRHLMELLLSQMRKLKVHKVKQTVELYTLWAGWHQLKETIDKQQN